jgi:hypothetical protein
MQRVKTQEFIVVVTRKDVMTVLSLTYKTFYVHRVEAWAFVSVRIHMSITSRSLTTVHYSM